MKPIKQILRRMFVAAGGLALAFAPAVFAQTNLQFTAIAQTQEQAIQLTWASVSNEVYEIDEADTLGTNAEGGTTWNQLYTEYPSQGTNTFWLDTGNYFDVPPIVHPKYSAARFYRVVDLGPDTTSDEPMVSIAAPTNGSVVSGSLTITVNASTDQATLSTLLYVDGQEMPPAVNVSNSFDNGTNYCTATYVINSCEWLNGQHVFFATARCASTAEGPGENGPMFVGHAVSAFVPVVFNNLVTEIAFSQPFFDPTLGQTQQVTAIFPEDSDWTLTIIDVNSNTVRTASGSGTSLTFNWDGNDNGENSLPAGTYLYLISAQTNGETPAISGGSSGSSSGGSSSPDFASSSSLARSDATQLWAEPSDGSGSAAPLVIYPPGFDTNGLTIFEMPIMWSPMENMSVSSTADFTPMDSTGGGDASPDGAPAPSSSQSAPPAPVRPPTAPVRGTVATFGIDYQTYSANGTNGFNVPSVPTGEFNGLIQMEGYPANTPLHFGSLNAFKSEVNNFITTMKKGAWNCSFVNVDNQVTISSLSGSGTPFNQVSLGVLLVHGTYGTSMDYTANGCEQMYFPITSGTSGQYIRMSQMNFGGSGTNGLKWMLIGACFSLHHHNWQSMQSQQVYPYNSNLHFILGADTIMYADSVILQDWANYMLGDPASYPPETPQTIQEAWYSAGIEDYGGQNLPSPITLACAGDNACQNDTLQTNTPPSGTQFYFSAEVH
jgi:hypothetical protein